MLMEVLEAGAEELETSEEVFEIFTEQTDFAQVRDYLEEEGFTLAQSELTMIPMNTVSLSDEDYEILENIIDALRSEEHTSELQSRFDLVCRLLLEKKKNKADDHQYTLD